MNATEPGRRPVRLFLDAVGIVLLGLAIYFTAIHFREVINFYDEGLLLTGAQLVSRGAIPYRDFYSNYPPGIFVLIAGLWELTGPKAIVLRYLGWAIHILLAALAGRLAGRLSGRPFVPLAAALVLSQTVVLGLVPYAYLVALTLALIFAELWIRAVVRPTPARFALAGLVLGLVSAFRHDAFVYLCTALTLVVAIGAARRRFVSDSVTFRHLAWAGLGFSIPLEVTWLPVFTLAGFRAVVNDLYFDQVRYTMPARVLPFPSLFPESLYHAHPASLCLVLAGPALAVALVLSNRGRVEVCAAIAVGCVAVAVISQSVGRCDAHHVAYSVTPALILASALLDRLAARPSIFVATNALFPAVWLVTTTFDSLLRLPITDPSGESNPVVKARPLPMVRPAARAEVLSFIAGHSQPGEPIFVGGLTHRNLVSNELDLYYMADRPGAVRRLQFDPNVVTRAKFQREMIAELEQTRPSVVVLSNCCREVETNKSNNPGSVLLDGYLQSKYVPAQKAGHYLLLLRQPGRATEGAPDGHGHGLQTGADTPGTEP